MPIKRRKISELEEAKDLTGFFTIGYRILNGAKKSVKYGLEHIQTAYENMLKAMEEAKEATTDMRQLEATVQENEENRETAESRRNASEQGRCNEEEKRVETEEARVIAENKRIDAESGRVTEEDARHDAELARANAESLRVTEENTRKTAETGRMNAENNRVTEEGKRATAEKGRVDAESGRVSEFATLKQNAETATANANDTANHPTYIGEDHYVYKWNKATKAYDKTDIYVKGDAFSIKKVYASVAALQADVNNAEIEVGDFVLVNTNNVEDPDNAKLYVKVNTNGSYAYDFLVDMSGAIGFTGKTPQLSIGTVSSGTTPAVTLSENGVDSNGNPRYKLNLVLPKGEKGEAPVLQIGTITTGTPGGQASASITANGSTSEGAPIFKLNMTIPQGPQGKGNVNVTESGLVSGKTYLFKPSANNSATGTLVNADEKYLKLTGGTMTDRIHFKADTEHNRYIDFITTNNTYLGSFGINDTGLDVNNSISGKQFQLKNNGDILYGGKKVWHEGNDGSGSGLDADLLDGKRSSAFALLDANGKVAKAIIADSANKLATARTLWGQSFNGNDNVSGNMTGVGKITSSGEISTSSLIKAVSSSSESGGFFRIGHPGGSWNHGLGAYNIAIENNDQQTPLLLAYRSGTSNYLEANRLFAMEFLNNGSILRFSFAGIERHTFDKSGNIVIGGNISATTFVGALQGNADTATKLQTARKINGVDFDGTTDINIPGYDIGVKSPWDGPWTYPMGITMNQIYNQDWPIHYGNALTMRGLGDTQIITEWSSAQEAAGDDVMLNMFVRGRRDNLSDWSEFRRVITEGCDFSGRNIRLSGDIVSAGYVYTQTGWFQNNRSGVGLYNEAEELRWYAGQYGGKRWFSDGGAAFAGSVNGDQGFYKTSDIRLKSNIKPLSHSLDQILSIPTSSFTMYDKDQIGTIAQEIEKICPEVVTETIKRRSEVPDSDWETVYLEEGGEQVEYVKVKQVEYEMLSVLALEGLKLLNQEVEDLKKQLNIK